ncbi:MAG: hypothetical protein R2939_08335 [Kofleriaceae bacterium]
MARTTALLAGLWKGHDGRKASEPVGAGRELRALAVEPAQARGAVGVDEGAVRGDGGDADGTCAGKARAQVAVRRVGGRGVEPALGEDGAAPEDARAGGGAEAATLFFDLPDAGLDLGDDVVGVASSAGMDSDSETSAGIAAVAEEVTRAGRGGGRPEEELAVGVDAGPLGGAFDEEPSLTGLLAA